MKKRLSLTLLTIVLLMTTFAERAQAYYSPDAGRFINRDPIEERGGENVYAFVRNDGVNAIDHLGMYETRVLALEAAYKSVGDATLKSRNSGMQEFKNHFTEKASWLTIKNNLIHDSKDYRSYPHGFIDSDNNLNYVSNAGFITIIFGVEYGRSVFCCKNANGKEYILGEMTRGALPFLRDAISKSIHGQVVIDETIPDGCSEGIMTDTVHSHNIALALVRTGGLEDYQVLAEPPSEADQEGANRRGVPNHAVVETGVGTYSSGIASPIK